MNNIIEKFKEKLDGRTNKLPNEYALYHAMKLFEEDVLSQFNNCATFYEFHKSFRQVDVTNSVHGDMILWELLSASEIAELVFYSCKNSNSATADKPKTR